MAPFDVAFVDSISATPTVRLSLSTSVWTVLVEGLDVPPPLLERAVTRSLLTDGGRVSAAAYGLRTLTLSLQLSEKLTDDEAATNLQALARELDRPGGNLLRYQVGTSKPVFFRTFRSDFGAVTWDAAIRHRQAEVRLLTEPFALGLVETASGSPFTVPNNPASAGGHDFSVSGVIGDVETPAFIRLTTSSTSGRFVIGMRRRDVSSTIAMTVQAEAGTLGTDTTLPGNDAVMSGAGSNYTRTSFATVTARADRVTTTFPLSGSESAEHRGTYRVFARVRKSVAGDVITLVPSIGGVEQRGATLPLAVGPMTVDLGLVTLGGVASAQVGYSAVQLPPNERVVLRAGRTSGSGNLDIDYVDFVPADELLTIVSWSGPAAGDYKNLDGPNDSTYVSWDDPLTNVNAKVRSAVISRDGGLPALMPGVENRFIMSLSRSDTGDTLGDSATVTISYWPRYLTVARPVTT